MSDKKICGNCKHWRDEKFCFANPPVLSSHSSSFSRPDKSGAWHRPVVGHNDHPCRHWESFKIGLKQQ